VADGVTTAAHPLLAPYYADGARHVRTGVVENVRLARDTFRVRLDCPAIGRAIVPGQFIMLRLAGVDDPLLGRPLALYDTWLDDAGTVRGIDVVYLVVGRMTRRLAMVRAGDELEAWGPLGNGFAARGTPHLIMAAGGIGQTPFLAVGREALGGRRYGAPSRPAPPVERVTLCYGVRSADLLAGVDDFRAAGIEVRTPSGRRPRTGVRGLAGDADGLRRRHLLQLRGESPPARRPVGLQADLRRGPRVRRRQDRVVTTAQPQSPNQPPAQAGG
jgi:dihydroorotate dehydrogenase electron transfer subunit